MPEKVASLDDDFSAQLEALILEAGHRPARQLVKSTDAAPVTDLSEPAEVKPGEEPKPSTALPSLPQMLRPLVLGIEALTRAQGEHSNALDRIDKSIHAHASLEQVLLDTKQALDQRNTVSKAMFEALHSELKGYKDGFLIETVMRPIIRDLISLYDDTFEIHRQMNASINDKDTHGGLTGRGILLMESLQQMVRNIDHNLHFILEVLERMEVTYIPSNTGKLDKRTQRAVAVEAAENPDDDQNVVRVVKRGFQCKDRVVRPEEVVIQKWKEGFLVAINPPQAVNKPLSSPE